MDEYHNKYIAALTDLWDTNKPKYGDSSTADLKLVEEIFASCDQEARLINGTPVLSSLYSVYTWCGHDDMLSDGQELNFSLNTQL